jgi:hypothetical protein
VPDQSLSYERSGQPQEQAQTPGDPSDMTANSPTQATQESQESNVTRASEGEQVQARQTIEGDPTVGTGDMQNPPENQFSGGTGLTESQNYDDEDEWPYRRLQQAAKARTGDGSGRREELVSRLREADASAAESSSTDENSEPQHLQGVETTDATTEDTTGDIPRQPVDSSQVDNGGIQRTDRGQEHSEILQGLSQQRREQQLAAVKERSARSEA